MSIESIHNVIVRARFFGGACCIPLYFPHVLSIFSGKKAAAYCTLYPALHPVYFFSNGVFEIGEEIADKRDHPAVCSKSSPRSVDTKGFPELVAAYVQLVSNHGQGRGHTEGGDGSCIIFIK